MNTIEALERAIDLLREAQRGVAVLNPDVKQLEDAARAHRSDELEAERRRLQIRALSEQARAEGTKLTAPDRRKGRAA